MSQLPGKKRAQHKQPRQVFDWYRETAASVRSLFEYVKFEGVIHDPACGLGRIVEIAREYGYVTTGSDIGDYGFGEAGIDFRADLRPRDSLIFNGPYKLNEAFIAHAFAVAEYQIAMLTRIPFLNGQERYHSLYRVMPPELVLILSERPSMPPGDSDSPAKNGTADYAWVVWPNREQRRRGGYRTIIDWAEPQAPPRQDWLRAAEQIRRFGPGSPCPRSRLRAAAAPPSVITADHLAPP